MRRRRPRRLGLVGLGFLVAGALACSPAWASVPEEPFTEAPSAITGTTATFNGEVNHGVATEKVTYHFAYSTGGECTGSGLTAPSESPFPEAEGNHKAVSHAVAKLEGSTEYVVCLIATDPADEEESAQGSSVTFKTLAAKPVIATERTESGSVTPFDAALEAEVNPERRVVTYHFEYSESKTLAGASSIGEGSLPGASEAQTAGPVDIGGGLKPATTYYYRVVASNVTGEVKGPIEHFTTSPLEAPNIEEASSLAVGQTTASLQVLINPEFQEATCKAFQYRDQAGFEASVYIGATEVPCEPEDLGSGGEPTTASAQLTGLTPNATYHYRVLVENASGVSEGPDQTFLTLPNPPGALTGAASSTTTGSAMIAGTVNPGSEGLSQQDDTSYFFQYGPTTSYGFQTPTGDAGEGTSPVAEAATVTGLEPGTIYHYRIVASNNNATPQTSLGADRTFTTTTTPPILSAVALSALSASSATITATLDPQGLPTRYELALGATPGALQTRAFGNTTSAGAIALALSAESLTPGTVYYYKLIATNSNGTAESPETSITTSAGPGGPSLLGQPPTPPLLAVPAIAFPRSAISPSVSIAKIKVTPGGLIVTLKTSQKGTVRITGNRIRTTSARNVAAGSHQIKVALTNAGRKLAKAHGRTSVSVSLAVGGQAASTSRRVRL